MGGRVSREQIAAVIDRSEKELDQALDQLVNAELVFREGRAPRCRLQLQTFVCAGGRLSQSAQKQASEIHAKVAGALPSSPNSSIARPRY